MRRILASIILALALTPGIARADVITTYTLSNVETKNSATVTGSFKIDQTTYNNSSNTGFDGGSIVVSGDSQSDLNGEYVFLDYVNASVEFGSTNFTTINIPIGNPPITSGSIDLTNTQLFFTVTPQDDITAGTLDASTPTTVPAPQLSNLAGLGVLGLAYIWRRRRRIVDLVRYSTQP